MKLSKAEAKHLILSSQGLKDSRSSVDIINQLGYVQIDTLSVAERAHHHVFHTRNSAYEKTNLDKLVGKKQIFEYWSHAAAYLPISAYRFTLIKKASFDKGAKHWFPKNEKTNRFVLERITAEGPLQSKDFKDSRNTLGIWYDYKPAKVALEQLFMEGKLMIKERINFQKVYDLAERVLPADIDTSMPTADEFCTHLIKTTLQSQGVATLSEIGYLRKGLKPALMRATEKLVSSGELNLLRIEGLDREYYCLANVNYKELTNDLHILSPFDNLVIQRKRLIDLFDFEYQLECYVPEAKRKYGYYCLPVLYGDQFVARFDPKADRKTGVFTIKKLWFEPHFHLEDDFYFKFSKKIKDFALFCGCQQVIIDKCSSAIYKKKLVKALRD